MKRKIYKTKIYIPSESYLNQTAFEKPIIKETEMEVLVVPSYNFKYATDIISGNKIPIARDIHYFDFKEFLSASDKYRNKLGRLLSYFVIGVEERVWYDLAMIPKKKYLSHATIATEEDIIKYRKEHPNKDEYKKTQKLLFEGYNDRMKKMQSQKKMLKKMYK